MKTCQQDYFHRLSIARCKHQTGCMKKREPIPEIAIVVRRWLPNANDEELKQATIRLRRYLAVVYAIYLRYEAEGRFPLPRDNYEDGDTVDL
jgi:hypothetical protein